jgi:spore coat polysaccharide biosynthesis protein SpsF (cytidylyltransferase family)
MNVAIIQARLNSERFPGKVLEHVAGKPVLQHVIERVRKAALVDHVVVAALRNGGESVIAGHCEEWDTECLLAPHPEDNVLGRFAWAAKKTKADLVVRVCGDNPMVNPAGIDELLAAAIEHGADYTGYRDPDGRPTILRPTGWFAEVVRRGALRRADMELPVASGQREHVTSWMYRNQRQYSCYWLDLPEWYTANDLPDVAIDRPEDIEDLEAWLAEFDNKENWPWK